MSSSQLWFCTSNPPFLRSHTINRLLLCFHYLSIYAIFLPNRLLTCICSALYIVYKNIIRSSHIPCFFITNYILHIRKLMLHKYHIPRDKKLFCLQVIHGPPFLPKRVSNKDTFPTLTIKFVSSMPTVMSVSQTTKHSQIVI